MGSLSSTDQRTETRRSNLSGTERGRPDCQGTKKSHLPSWDVSSVGCSLLDSRGNHGALMEANRASKEAMRRSSVGHGILGKVRDPSVW